MSLIVYSHSDCLAHQPPAGHPERPARLEAALQGIGQLRGVELRDAAPADPVDLSRIHPAAYLDQLQQLDAAGTLASLDPDTWLGPGSLRAAQLAAGAVCQGVDQVMLAPEHAVFAVIRPPGHHAEAARAMGFCLLSSVAAGARRATDQHGLERVAVVDFDVHHGNGTEAILAGDERCLFISSHQWPLYPGTGDPDQPVAPNILNATLPPNAGSDEFRSLWADRLLPAIDAFRPELIVVSAGFDAHWRDPLAQLQLKDQDFFWIGEQLTRLARQHASGRLVASLEGGYDLVGLTESVLAFGESLD